MTAQRGKLGAWWSRRRWVYAAWLVVAVARIPARTGFRLHVPACNVQMNLQNMEQSLAKTPHIILFAVFFLLTAVQFDRVDRTMLGWSFVATLVMGFLVELEEGATRTGNCRLADLLPDALGALIAAALLAAVAFLLKRRPAS